MKRFCFLFLVALCAAVIFSCQSQTEKNNECREMLMAFYNEYLYGSETQAMQYCDPKLASAVKLLLADMVIDADPFIGAQDIIGGLERHEFEIECSKAEYGDGWWSMRYDTGYDGETSVPLHVAKQQGKYVIDDVMLWDGVSVMKMRDEYSVEEK